MPDEDGFPQVKAISLIMSGTAFILIAIKPTIPEGETVPTGADFFTSLYGDDQTLRDAGPHLPDVIGRLFHQRGLF